MKNRKYLIGFLSLICILYALLTIIIVLKNNWRLNDYQPLTITRQTANPYGKPMALLKEKRANLTIKAYANNLGIIAIKITNEHSSPQDTLTFRIKEDMSASWYYQHAYSAKQLQSGYYYFGFPIISDSKNKTYVIELASTEGATKQTISVDPTASFISKYAYGRVALRSLPMASEFFLSKTASLIANLTRLDIMLLLSFVAIFLTLFIKGAYVYLGAVWLKFLYDIRAAISWNRLIKWHRLDELKLIILCLGVYFLALIYNATRQSKGGFFVGLILLAYALFCFLRLKTRLYNWLRNHYQACISATAFVILRLLFLNTLPQWDGRAYFLSLIESSSTNLKNPVSFLISNAWYGHPSHAYSLYMAIGQHIFPNSFFVVHIQNILLGAGAVTGLYVIFRSLGISKTSSSLGALLMGIQPLFVASSLYPNLDYPFLCFFIISLACLRSNKLVLFSFFFLSTIFTKEVGVVVTSLFMFIYALLSIWQKNGLFVYILKARNALRNGRIFFLAGYLSYIFFPIFVFSLYLYLTGGKRWLGAYYVNPPTPFVFDQRLYLTRFFEITTLNFNWILSLGTIILLAAVLIRKIRNLDPFVIALAVTNIAYVGFIFVYNTYPHPRYILITLFPLMLLFYYLFYKANAKSRYGYASIVIILFLFLIQNFKTVDPVSKYVFGAYKIGHNEVLKIGDYIQSRIDALTYNTEFTWEDSLLRAFYKETAINENSVVVISSPKGATQSIKKWAVEYSVPIDRTSLDKTFSTGTTFIPRSYFVNSLPTKADYYVYLPWYSENGKDNDLPTIKSKYSIQSEHTINRRGYWLKYYKLK